VAARPPLTGDDAALVDVLGRRSPSESLPLMLEVARRHAARRRPSDIVAQYARDAFVVPSALDLRTAHRLDAIALDTARDFDAVLLSPLAPLGSCSVVSPTTQDRAVTTARGTEVVSDPTNVLALECARRLALDPQSRVRLCTLHQVVRPQRFGKQRGFSQHFRLFALAEAGAALPDHRFEVETIAAHAALFVRLFDAAEAIGYRLFARRVKLLAAPRRRPIADRLRVAIATALPGVELEEGELDSGYYDGVRCLVYAATAAGDPVQLGDVGLFDWMAKLTSNRRFRFVASGLGIQLFPILFRAP